MKIEKKILQDYLTKVSINNTVENCLLDFKENGVEAKSVDRCQVMTSNASLSKEHFVEYTAVGEVPLKDLTFVSKIVKVFPGIVNMTTKGNTISFKNEKNTKALMTKLASKELITQAPDISDLKFETKPLVIETEILKKAVSDVKSVFGERGASEGGDKVKLFSKGEGSIHIVTEDNSENKIRTSKVAMTEKFSVEFSFKAFSDIIDCLSEEKVELYLQTDYPIKIVEHGKINASYVIAPRIGQVVSE